MSRVPLGTAARADAGSPRPASWDIDMPNQYVAAERIARRRALSRADLDAFGLRSQTRAQAAWAQARFDREVVPVKAPGEAGTRVVDRDEGLRETSLEGLAALKPVLDGGLHTAGTSSQVSDGAAAVLVVDADRPGHSGCAPGHGSSRRAWSAQIPTTISTARSRLREGTRRARMTIADIELFEVNEAFASVVLSWPRCTSPTRPR